MEFRIVDSYPNRPEIVIKDENALRDFLREVSTRGGVFLLIAPDSRSLTIGISKSFGFVEYVGEDDNPPYLIAVDSTQQSNDDSYIEFDSGGTATPVHASKCLPLEKVIEIAIYFSKNGNLPKFVEWHPI
jgi:hypothetical protein